MNNRNIQLLSNHIFPFIDNGSGNNSGPICFFLYIIASNPFFTFHLTMLLMAMVGHITNQYIVSSVLGDVRSCPQKLKVSLIPNHFWSLSLRFRGTPSTAYPSPLAVPLYSPDRNGHTMPISGSFQAMPPSSFA